MTETPGYNHQDSGAQENKTRKRRLIIQHPLKKTLIFKLVTWILFQDGQSSEINIPYFRCYEQSEIHILSSVLSRLLRKETR